MEAAARSIGCDIAAGSARHRRRRRVVAGRFNELMAQVPVPADLQHRPTTIGGVDAVEVTVQGMDADNVILYFHGGVYVIGTAADSVPLVAELARRTGAKAVTVDYRLAPNTRIRRRSKMPKPRTRGFSVRAST